MKRYEASPRRWTLSFYQAKGGVREITVADGPCLTGNSTIEVVPAEQLEGAVEAWRTWRTLAADEDSDLEELGQAWQVFEAAMDALDGAGGQ